METENKKRSKKLLQIEKVIIAYIDCHGSAPLTVRWHVRRSGSQLSEQLRGNARFRDDDVVVRLQRPVHLSIRSSARAHRSQQNEFLSRWTERTRGHDGRQAGLFEGCWFFTVLKSGGCCWWCDISSVVSVVTLRCLLYFVCSVLWCFVHGFLVEFCYNKPSEKHRFLAVWNHFVTEALYNIKTTFNRLCRWLFVSLHHLRVTV